MGHLIDADDSVLVVVDVQPGFLRKLDRPVAERVVECTVWLLTVARALSIPVVVTEEEPERHGATEPSIVAALGEGIPRLTKETFGLTGSPAILAAIEATRRRNVVLVGLETDVCVAQSALGLADRAFRPAVVLDAVAAPGAAHQQGLDRLRDAGILLIGLKGLYYEWLRTVDRCGVPGLPSTGPAGVIL